MNVSKTFYLKAAVIVRAVAEVVALCVVALLPLSYLFIDAVRHLPLPFQLAGATTAVIALLTLPVYAHIVWRIKISEQDITLKALCRTQQIKWSAITRLHQQSTWNSPEYVLTTEVGEVHFPARFNQQDELASLIRKHLPNEGRSKAEIKEFTQSTISILIEIAKSVFLLAVVVCAWSFYIDVGLSPKTGLGDSILLLAASVSGTAIVLSRAAAIFFMPRNVHLSKNEIQIKCLTWQRTFVPPEAFKLTRAIFFLPAGMVLKSPHGSFFITDRLSGYDELIDELQHKIAIAKRAPS